MPGAITSKNAFIPQWPPAPKVVGPTTKSATRPTNQLPKYLSEESKKTARVNFDKAKHIAFEPPKNIVKMKDIGLEGHGISPNAVSDPFPLFSKEAVEQIRAEVFSEEVLKDRQFCSTFNKNMIRGIGPARAPFTYSAWKSPDLISSISQVAGIDLVPSMDFEIANINISIGEGNEQATVTMVDHSPLGDGLSAVAWHYDSFPFVCVVMLSDCANMIGGETAIRTPGGDILKVRGPSMGTAVVLQGRYIEHQALKAFGGKERISMVTCFRPRSPAVRDETVLVGVRAISYKSELYTQYTEYRLELLEEQIRAKQREERDRQVAKKDFDIQGMRAWLAERRDFIDSMITEIEEEDE
ncbi:hypothetical protein GMORB2_3511 [Geosmithia morbida]|uniref:Fe2OG dioxygenase domain-containing protein n=1 Tax=Geosmithia morbida TaxID=1094350 RepID=A0A9P4YQD6_9HYPO|nr:uncharacterized protein GMORB2_3511 [Geosmithia morbida]KAF4120100.1 hypothetical protein GMORB2_3511 [Geosmithia morbida]